MFTEYESVRPDDPLRQGDVLEAVNDDTEVWGRLLMVITADCDLAHNKNAGRVTCVPFIGTEDYIDLLHLVRFREKLINKQIDAQSNLLRKSDSPAISPERLREWPSDAEDGDILAALSLPPKLAIEYQRCLDSIRLVDAKANSFNEMIENLICAQTAGSMPPKRERAESAVNEAVRSAFKNTPGDALFISAVGPGRDSGYFAYLRHLELVAQSQISIGSNRIYAEYRRIARISDRFTHALVQRFAQVFTSIGLPDEYEQVRDLHASLTEMKESI